MMPAHHIDRSHGTTRIPFFVPLPIMFLGVIIGTLQALIFIKLTMIYLSAAVATEEQH